MLLWDRVYFMHGYPPVVCVCVIMDTNIHFWSRGSYYKVKPGFQFSHLLIVTFLLLVMYRPARPRQQDMGIAAESNTVSAFCLPWDQLRWKNLGDILLYLSALCCIKDALHRAEILSGLSGLYVQYKESSNHQVIKINALLLENGN